MKSESLIIVECKNDNILTLPQKYEGLYDPTTFVPTVYSEWKKEKPENRREWLEQKFGSIDSHFKSDIFNGIDSYVEVETLSKDNKTTQKKKTLSDEEYALYTLYLSRPKETEEKSTIDDWEDYDGYPYTNQEDQYNQYYKYYPSIDNPFTSKKAELFQSFIYLLRGFIETTMMTPDIREALGISDTANTIEARAKIKYPLKYGCWKVLRNWDIVKRFIGARIRYDSQEIFPDIELLKKMYSSEIYGITFTSKASTETPEKKGEDDYIKKLTGAWVDVVPSSITSDIMVELRKINDVKRITVIPLKS